MQDTPPESEVTSVEAQSDTDGLTCGRPPFPWVFILGIILYAVTFAIGVVSIVAANKKDLEELEEGGLVAMAFIACTMLLVMPVEIFGVVMACLGRAWGAIIFICTTLVYFVLSIGAGFILPLTILDGVVLAGSLATLACFVVPMSWDYYAACAAYRRSR